jgi:ATPase family associated with various cellular activities (AAA)
VIVGFYGNVRQGKTYSAVLELFILWIKGYTIYSNTWLAFPFKKLTLDNLFDIIEEDLNIEDNAVFFIDEIPIWLDSRCSSSKRNRIISYFLAQTGKLGNDTDYGLILIFTAQYPDMIDKRLKHFTDKGVICEKFDMNGIKHFLQNIHIFRGNKSYSYRNIIRGHPLLYSLYDTRKKIRYEVDRYQKGKDMSIEVEVV